MTAPGMTPRSRAVRPSARKSTAPMKRNLLLDAAILLALALLGAVAYKVAPLLKPETDVEVPAACDPGRQTCTVALPDRGKLVLDITPRPIPSLQPLRIEARVSGVEAKGVDFDLAGVDMKMGYNRLQLQPQGDGTFLGQSNLPVCITGKMKWLATVIVDTGERKIAVPFRFESGRE